MPRFLDVVLSGLALLILSPFLLPVALILRLTGEREVFYLQKRVGRNRRYFGVYKFATMKKNSPSMGAGTITLKDDPRVLPLGKFLRKTKINELPQLLNIVLGDMALVGPRPLVIEGEKKYDESAAARIRSVRPGLTGLGSLLLGDEEGLYSHRPDAAEFYSSVIMPYKQTLELYYVENRSFWLDMMIILLTIAAVVYPSFDPEKLLDGVPPAPAQIREVR